MTEQQRAKFAEFTEAESKAVERILDRFEAHGYYERLHWRMNLAAAHYICPLDLEALAEADSFTIAHDLGGIERHLDKQTGSLGFFHPRTAKQ